MAEESTIRHDILAALIKERDRISNIRMMQRSEAETARLDLCLEFISRVKAASEDSPVYLEITQPLSGPLRL